MFFAHLLNPLARSSLLQVKLQSCRTIHGRLRNYYEVLKLKQNCSSKDIKQAYIDLSKKYHPDRNNNIDSKYFLEVAEAYKVLSKENTRREYDLTVFPNKVLQRVIYEQSTKYSGRNPMDDPSFHHNRDRSRDKYYQSESYYGIKGVQRMSNSVILVACLLLMAVGVTIQVLALRHSVTFRRDALMYQSALANQSLEKTRQTAEQNGNKLQLAILAEKFRSLE